MTEEEKLRLERDVLLALSRVPTDIIRVWHHYTLEPGARALWEAELARRGEAPLHGR